MRLLPGRHSTWFCAGLLTLFANGPADAHFVSSGLGPFYDGVTHFAQTPADWIMVLAVALLAGMQGSDAARMCLLLPAGWLVGGLTGQHPMLPEHPFLLPCVLMTLGSFTACNVRVSAVVVAIISGMLGFVLGHYNGVSAYFTSGGTATVLGISTGALVFSIFTAGIAVKAAQGWQRIILRIVGSWMTASGLLMLGWALHNSGRG